MNLQNEPVVGDPLGTPNRWATIRRATADNGAFSKAVPGLQLTWDSVSSGLLKTCPYKYFLSQVLGFVPKGENVHLVFGIALHSSLEAYDRARASGSDWRAGVRAAIRMALTSTGARTPARSACLHCSLYEEDIERTAEPYTDAVGGQTWAWRCRSCGGVELGAGEMPTQWVAWQSRDSLKNLHNLIKAVVWYLDKFADDPTQTVILKDGRPAVELTFQIDVGPTGISSDHYVLAGHLDRLVEFGGSTFVQDRKTTKQTLGQSYFDKFSPDNQMTLYSLAGKLAFEAPVAGVMVDAIQTLTHAVRFKRKILSRTQGQLEDWWRDFQQLLAQNESYVRNMHWPQNDMACSNYGGCPYLKVCSMDKSSHWAILMGEYKQAPWDPTIVRTGIDAP